MPKGSNSPILRYQLTRPLKEEEEKKLQDPANKQYCTPDATMEPIFGKEKFLKDHLTN